MLVQKSTLDPLQNYIQLRRASPYIQLRASPYITAICLLSHGILQAYSHYDPSPWGNELCAASLKEHHKLQTTTLLITHLLGHLVQEFPVWNSTVSWKAPKFTRGTRNRHTHLCKTPREKEKICSRFGHPHRRNLSVKWTDGNEVYFSIALIPPLYFQKLSSRKQISFDWITI